jgi:AraC family L-rhamnose operon transcriptional activator RhaR
VLILSGSGRHLTDTDDYPIAAGDVFVIRGSMRHGYADTRGMALVNILFSARGLKLPMSDLGDLPGYHALFRIEPRLRAQAGFRGRLRLAPAQLGAAVAILTRLEREAASPHPGHRFMACAHLMEMVGFLSRCYASDAPETRPVLGIGRVLSYMEQHLDERIPVRALARQAAMSESSLTRSFRRILGRSPADYLIHLRVARAMDLLQREDLRITEVAFRCGFGDSNYFSRQFRRVTGRSPSQYRATLR